jgi:hypothetical protein
VLPDLLMVETQENEGYTSDSKGGITVCCPRCKSKDVIMGDSREGYYWVYLCNNCGYRGKEGDKVGCLDKDDRTKIRQ